MQALYNLSRSKSIYQEAIIDDRTKDQLAVILSVVRPDIAPTFNLSDFRDALIDFADANKQAEIADQIRLTIQKIVQRTQDPDVVTNELFKYFPIKRLIKSKGIREAIVNINVPPVLPRNSAAPYRT